MCSAGRLPSGEAVRVDGLRQPQWASYMRRTYQLQQAGSSPRFAEILLPGSRLLVHRLTLHFYSCFVLDLRVHRTFFRSQTNRQTKTTWP